MWVRVVQECFTWDENPSTTLNKNDLTAEQLSTLNALFDSGVSPTIIAKAMTESVHSSTGKKVHSWLKILLTLLVMRGKLLMK